MFCSNCGNELNENDIFCQKCGTKRMINPKTETKNKKIVSKSDKTLSIILTIVALIFHYVIPFVLFKFDRKLSNLSDYSDIIFKIGFLLSVLVSYILIIIALVKNSSNVVAILTLVLFIIGFLLDFAYLLLLESIACACKSLAHGG